MTGVGALGAGCGPEQWCGARAANVHLASFVQQKILLPACDLFITHGGFNSTREAPGADVPMVALLMFTEQPVFTEQPANVARIVELGAGVRLNMRTSAPTALGSAIVRVLGEPAFRARARGMQRRTLALLPLNQITQNLAALAR